jgi:hypothetical protein
MGLERENICSLLSFYHKGGIMDVMKATRQICKAFEPELLQIVRREIYLQNCKMGEKICPTKQDLGLQLKSIVKM